MFIDGLSAHADYSELTEWLRSIRQPPLKTFIVHGEPQSQDAFRRYLNDQPGWETVIPGHGDTEILE